MPRFWSSWKVSLYRKHPQTRPLWSQVENDCQRCQIQNIIRLQTEVLSDRQVSYEAEDPLGSRKKGSEVLDRPKAIVLESDSLGEMAWLFNE